MTVVENWCLTSRSLQGDVAALQQTTPYSITRLLGQGSVGGVVMPSVQSRLEVYGQFEFVRREDGDLTFATSGFCRPGWRRDGHPPNGAQEFYSSRAQVGVQNITAFQGRRMLIAYYFMWHAGRPAPAQCAECTV